MLLWFILNTVKAANEELLRKEVEKRKELEAKVQQGEAAAN